MTRNLKEIEALRDVFSQDSPTVSFEFFPPKTEEMEATLWESIKTLEPFGPKFVSVTYGAGGSTRERTHATLKRVVEETGLSPAAHLTCVNASKDEIREIAQDYWEMGVRHIVALRGDPPQGIENYTPHPNGYHYADELVSGLKEIADFEISVAAYPETHPHALSAEADLDHLKRKVDAGATRAITQYFFDVDVYLRFLDKARGKGIALDIVPGILPITNFAQLVKFSKMCGATVPAWLANVFEGLDDRPPMRNYVAACIAAEQCRLLRKEGIHTFHFYTLNRSELVSAICCVLGLKPKI